MKNLCAIFVLLLSQVAFAANPYVAKPYAETIGPVAVGNSTNLQDVPILTWGGEASLFLANGGVTTAKGSIFDQLGLKLRLVNGDDFDTQVRNYLRGSTPLLRGTVGMTSAASDILNKDPRTKPIQIIQETFSIGDHIVAREDIKTLNDLKGKKIALQLPVGPHLDLIRDSLLAAGFTANDVTLIACKDLTGDEKADSPANVFRKDKSVSACCVISPDMLGLCSAIDKTGTGLEGTVKGAHVVNSTASMSKSIVDGFWVRGDYNVAHPDEIEKFVVGYLKGTEQLLKIKEAYKDGQGRSPEYVTLMKNMQKFYGEKVLPTIENDVHGLISDANFVRIPGNESYFDDPNNLVGFSAKMREASAFALQLGLITKPVSYDKAKWDYKKLSASVGVPYNAPKVAQGRVKVEDIDFSEIDSDVIVSFEINFDAEKTEFPLGRYGESFDKVFQNAALFGRGAVVVRGHSDTLYLLREFFRAAKAKGLITGSAGNYKFKGKPLDLAKTNEIVQAIQTENFAGLSDERGPIDDPRIVAASLQSLSQDRANAVKTAIEGYARTKGVTMDFSQIQPVGAGVSTPRYPRPRNESEASANRRVEFLIVKRKAESISDFDFDK